MEGLLWILAIVSGWAAIAAWMNLLSVRRLRRLARSRAGADAFATFRSSLPEIPENVLQKVYRGVQELVRGEDFPVRAEDHLTRTLEIDEGSLVDLFEELLDPRAQAARGQGTGPELITTVADLARALWHERQTGTDDETSQSAP
jgi:hypothetical protein